jgi:hypothetical protein
LVYVVLYGFLPEYFLLSTPIDFLHFPMVKIKKFLHIRVPHIEKSLDIQKTSIWIFILKIPIFYPKE